LAVIPSLTWGASDIPKASSTRGTEFQADTHCRGITFALFLDNQVVTWLVN